MRPLIDALGSRRLTVYVLLAYAVFLLFLAAWGVQVPKEVVGSISRLAPFGLIYVLAGIHLVCCLIVFWPLLARRVALERPTTHPGFPVSGTLGSLSLAGERAGFRLRWLEAGGCAALHRNRWSPAGTFASHAALLLLPLAFLASRATRFEGEAWIIEGRSFGGTAGEYTRVEPRGGFEERAPRVAFDVDGIEAEFWGERLFFTDLRALVTLRSSDTGEKRLMRLPQPLSIDGARVSLKGFNYTPVLELRGPGGALIESTDLNLRLFPPGTEDSFAVPGLPHRAFVRLYPNSAGPEARPISRGYRLEQPLFHVAVVCGKRLRARGWLRVGEPLAFDGYTLAFPAIRKGGDISIHRDRGYPILWAALGLAFAGTLARIAFPSSRLWVFQGIDGPRAVVREDVFARGRARRFLHDHASSAG